MRRGVAMKKADEIRGLIGLSAVVLLYPLPFFDETFDHFAHEDR